MVHKITNFVGRRVRAAYPGAHLVEIFPWMMAFPSWLAKWKRDAESWFKIDSKMFRDLYMNASTVKVDGQEEHTFSTLLAENQERLTLNNDEASWLSGVFCAAGTETTAAVLAFFIQAMVCYPAVQARAQVEIDQVCTPSNPPTFEDAERLPYIRAIVKEILRWKAVDPVGLPRRATEDDVYDGYFIPKGSIIIANVWGMNRDPDVYGPDAAEFRPERHLTEDGKVVRIPHTKEEGHVTYGFGRRICAGVGVANDSLFIDIATILWACRIGPGKGADGKPVYVDPAGILNTGLELRPPPFPCSITPRFPSAAAVLAEKMDRF
ncbi:cytochrome P450 [Punctularia strigosozonata HHB-11173 SS5]|uniref:cytochrome P450 n=1 Tax=Punctularia strigosozonata (strain HHB-11173) TaxID=741275 RepID=UPI000441857F|nr:cytochrome P450 [Punctularia strigosozonata HHB-11173 SS5]EIN11994.1 cytochrome P450 [Punctularia strigosozonata HHB-11173 SS5]